MQLLIHTALCHKTTKETESQTTITTKESASQTNIQYKEVACQESQTNIPYEEVASQESLRGGGTEGRTMTLNEPLEKDTTAPIKCDKCVFF